jgi:hypothetical protein
MNADAEKWQPIETAPKDGTEILTFRDGVISQCGWKDDLFGEKCWGHASWSYPQWSQPTHWMPLPEPPK